MTSDEVTTQWKRILFIVNRPLGILETHGIE